MKVSPPIPASDFALEDTHGKTVTLSGFRGERLVVIVFLRGFT
jgi:peroxiredoxin